MTTSFTRLIRKTVLVAAALVTTGGAASALYQALEERAALRRFPSPGKIVTVRGGRRSHIWVEGEDDRLTIVVVPGMSSSCLHWVKVQRKLLPGHRVLLYDRAGVGWSQAAPWWERRHSSRLADELHDVIEASGEHGPFLLVGHSLGGEVARLYQARHPEAVVGMILVDASTERWNWLVEEFGAEFGLRRHWKRALTHYLLKPRGLVRAGVRIRTALGRDEHFHRWARLEVPPDLVETSVSRDLTSGQRRASVMEMIDRGSAAALEAEARNLGDLPFVVLTKAPFPAPDTYAYSWAGPRTDQWRSQYAAVNRRIQQDLASLSTNSQLIVAERAGHNLQFDDPDLVAATIAELAAKIVSR